MQSQHIPIVYLSHTLSKTRLVTHTQSNTVDAVKTNVYFLYCEHFVVIFHRDLSRNEIRVIHRDAFLTLTALTNL